jgi:hypothetical protein
LFVLHRQITQITTSFAGGKPASAPAVTFLRLLSSLNKVKEVFMTIWT